MEIQEAYEILKPFHSTFQEKKFAKLLHNEKEILYKFIYLDENEVKHYQKQPLIEHFEIFIEKSHIVGIDMACEILTQELINYLSGFTQLSFLLICVNEIQKNISFRKLNFIKALNLNNHRLFSPEDSNNDFKPILEKITELSQLNSLVIGLPNLQKIPSIIGNMTELKELDLHNCNISSIPEELSKCRNLIALDLSNNPIEELPNFFNFFPNLQFLNMSKCKLKTLPNSIVTTRLKFFNYLGNNWQPQMLEIIRGDLTIEKYEFLEKITGNTGYLMSYDGDCILDALDDDIRDHILENYEEFLLFFTENGDFDFTLDNKGFPIKEFLKHFGLEFTPFYKSTQFRTLQKYFST